MPHRDAQQATLFDEAPAGDGHAADARPPRGADETRPGYQHVKRVGWIPEAWSDAKLGELLDDISAGYSAKSNDRLIQSGEVGVLKVSAVSYGRFILKSTKLFFKESETASRKVHAPDAFLSAAQTLRNWLEQVSMWTRTIPTFSCLTHFGR